eukprot:m.162788 g.162788  ORF g.162788 m.162788 type:complete len:503 (+) comp12236_c0_seq1:781-2289(+)
MVMQLRQTGTIRHGRRPLTALQCHVRCPCRQRCHTHRHHRLNAVKCSVLGIRACNGLCIRDGCKRNHFVLWNPPVGKGPVQDSFHLLAEAKEWRGGMVGHDTVVGHGEIGNGNPVRLPLRGKCRDGRREITVVLVNDIAQNHDVLKGGIHALTKEGHHGVCSIAHQHNLVLMVPGACTHRHQLARRVALVLVDVVGHQRDGVGEVGIEVLLNLSWCLLVQHTRHHLASFRVRGGCERRKESASKRLVWVWETNHHKLPTRPDVQGFWDRQGKVSRLWIGWNSQFFVPVPNVFAFEVHGKESQHGFASGRVCSVGTNGQAWFQLQVPLDIVVVRRGLGCDWGSFGGEVEHAVGANVHQFSPKVKGHTIETLCLIKQHVIEPLPSHRVDGIRAVHFIVRLRRVRVPWTCRPRMQRPTPHGNGVFHDSLLQSHGSKRTAPTVRQGKVDGALDGRTALVLSLIDGSRHIHAPVWPPFKEVDGKATALQHDGSQGSAETAAHHGYRL